MRNQPEYNVLLVEDDPRHAELINRAFATETHCRLTITVTLEQARSLIGNQSPDLIITDVRLPDGNGTELLDYVPDCPTIVMTGYNDENSAVSAMKSGAADYIVKTQETMASLPRTASRVIREWRLVIDQKLARERQQRLTAILEATPDLICIANLDGFVSYINQAGRKLLGIGEDEDIKRIRLADFHLPADGRKILGEGIPQAIAEGMWTDETTFVSLAGDRILTSQVLISHRNVHGEIEFFSTIARDIRHLRAAEERIEYLAYYDTLTGLPNRNELVKRLDIEIARVRRNRSHSALLFIDLDNFKYINDSMGHPAGDLVLQEMAQRLQAHLRGGDTVARLGGDEFIVILADLSRDGMEAITQAREIANKIRDTIAMECRIHATELQVTASIGISMITRDDTSGHDLLRFADTAMYQAKREGRNRLEFFTERMGSDVTRQLELENQLRRALREDQFRLFYQPLVDDTRQVIGVEALIRWQHPELGVIAPAEFLDVLESSGQIVEVGDWVIETALKQMTLWASDGLVGDDFLLCINISPRQFRDPQFAENINCQLERINVPARNIVMEVTEHNLIHNIDDAIQRMQELIGRGIRFSLDDFGTGYSSLAHLKNLPVKHIKIDRSFVKDICSDGGDLAMVASILALSGHLGLQVVAEGVEEPAQFEMLRRLGCRYFQGYYFSKPLSFEDMDAYLAGARQAI
ncbi:MAG: EAL domain-containing protein [Gammaproteobacteria bacterium]|nr:EAL domain-containing protein [Gammaproteobacteria bacterium]MDH3534232.1 EAL domain-containing protein [Gammaproteobacteria bacterium]